MESAAPSASCEFIIAEKDFENVTVKDASLDWTVKHLKATIQTEKNISWDMIELHHKNNVLEDDKKLSSYNVAAGDLFAMTLKTGYVVQDYGARKIYMRQASDNWTVGQLVIELKKVIRISVDIRLMYRGTMMQDLKTLGSYKVQPGDCITMAFRPTGGD